ncbi:protein asteroid isoform X2 [Polyergus mexicanus]|uniref:protein asteroid isoform X2 n=1 Tax=Polyergus mexicanus TaxID=615972 RepID=UPI0038B4502A
MGIPGLTTYISNHSDDYLENYALHDTYLVIDGNSIGCQLYNWYARCNCAFGGDYDKYAQCVANFFDELFMCNVIPLILIDGGCEDKKLKTIISRTNEKIGIASHYTPQSQQRTKFFPLLIKEVFKDVMKEKGVKYTQCIFEADNVIAAIARILNCPVLIGRGYMKRCKIYCAEKLFRIYNGLNQSLLPLAAILLGNDYVKQHTFRNFFRHLKLPRAGKKKYNEQQRRIDATFNWLRKHSLNQAVIGILSRLQKRERRHILNIIETIINGYISASLNVLHILDVPTENFSRANIQDAFKTYKFEGDIYNLTFIEEKPNEANLSDDDNETDEKEITTILEEKEMISNELLVNNLPEWFINEFKLGKYPSYFIDIIVRKLYVCATQVEDFLYVSSVVASLKIIGVIYGLLISGIDERKTCMEYMTRDENKKIKRYQLEYNDNILGCKLPSLFNLRELPIISRREILNTTLGIADENYVQEIPSHWTLYIATMKYWIDQQKESFKFTCHIYSLLFAMLFNIIDHKVGPYRNLNKFYHRFNKTVENIKYARKMRNYRLQYSIDTTLVNAFHEVNADDCLIAASFFISNFETDQKLYLQPKRFNITIVHGFAEFQNCLRHSMNLNALLEYPYEQTKVANVFNGTLLYNLCSNFKRRDDVEVYINSILQSSPSLSHLFNILLLKVKPLFNTALEKKASKYKKQNTKRYEKKESTTQEDHEKETIKTCESTNEETFYDNALIAVLVVLASSRKVGMQYWSSPCFARSPTQTAYFNFSCNSCSRASKSLSTG